MGLTYLIRVITFSTLAISCAPVFARNIIDSAENNGLKWYAEWIGETSPICNKNDDDYDTRICYNTLYGESGAVLISVFKRDSLIDTMNIEHVRYSKWVQEYDKDDIPRELKKDKFIQLNDYDGDGKINEFTYEDLSDPPGSTISLIRLNSDNHLEFVSDSSTGHKINLRHRWAPLSQNGIFSNVGIICGDHGADVNVIDVLITRSSQFHYFSYNTSCELPYTKVTLDHASQLTIYNEMYSRTKSNALSMCVMDEISYKSKTTKYNKSKNWDKKLASALKVCKAICDGSETYHQRLIDIPAYNE